MTVLAVPFALLIVAILSSDREGRAAARAWLKPRARWLWIPTLVIFLAILWPPIRPG